MTQLTLPLDGVSDTQRVRNALRQYLSEGTWWTLYELQERVLVETGIRCSDSSISARVRDLRKTKHGGYNIPLRKRTPRVMEYRIVPPGEE